MEIIRKRMCIGLERRGEWDAKLKTVLQRIIGAVGVQLSDEELARIVAIPDEVSNLIYAGMLVSFIVEFAGETCEVVLEYYPQEEEQDELDLSLLDVADWEVDSLTLRILVEDVSYAEEITGPALMSFCSDRLNVRVEQAGGGELMKSGEDAEGTSMVEVEEDDKDEVENEDEQEERKESE